MAGLAAAGDAAQSRIEEQFNLGWSFIRASKSTLLQAPDAKAAWQPVSIPHDYSIESKFVDANEKPLGELSVEALGLHLGQRSTGYLPGGPAWYKKAFKLPENCAGKRVYLLFDGVYMQSEVYLNGHKLGGHYYGYTAFQYDLTPYLSFDKPNELVVRTDNELKSRWYSGSGIYRDVTLVVTDPVHIPIWGTYVTTPSVNGQNALVEMETQIRNQSAKAQTVRLVSRILDPSNTEVSRVESDSSLEPGAEKTVKQNVTVGNARLWSPEAPQLYRVVSEVIRDGKQLDEYVTPFGIRTLKFDPDEGLTVNGQPTRLKGVCIHHDNGILGSEAYAWSEERKVIQLKEMGCNAIRFSHNPPSKHMLDACDKHGMLVIDEAFDEWRQGKAKGYSPVFDTYWKEDMTSMLLRDRNHPSVIMWSIGNEVPDQGSEAGPAIANMLSSYVKSLDPTRPTTVAVQPSGKAWGQRGKKGAPEFVSEEFFSQVDVCGYNYQNSSQKIGGDFKKNHQEFPKRIMYQSESMNAIFFSDWENILSTKYVLGDFVWTGVDYLGEVGCGKDLPGQEKFPSYFAMCGDLDICLFRKPRSFYRQIIWNREAIVHATVRRENQDKVNNWGAPLTSSSWTFDAAPGKTLAVDVYSGCEEAELFLNGKSLGRKPTGTATSLMATWDVPYEKGELKAVGYVKGKAVAEHSLKTAAAVQQISLKADRPVIAANGCDVAYLTVELVDSQGVRNPNAEAEITVELTGPATIAGIGTGRPEAPLAYPFHGNKSMTFQGRALLVIRSTNAPGSVGVKVTSLGLKAAEATVLVQ